ncbi:MAG TPA: transaldolase family protein, partial [Thermomicrobiales bacterium]|nr:transaldolase family protein [Thermomicrobiales bacterium]
MSTTQGKNPIKQLLNEGQSVWQDDISRQMIQSGLLAQRIEEVGIRGVTSNPTIFQKAISSGDAYDEEIIQLLGQDMDVAEVFQTLAVKDIQD